MRKQGVHNFIGKHIAVVGLGISNMALIRYLVGKGAKIIGLDRKTDKELGPLYEELRDLGVQLVLGSGYLEGLEYYDEVFVAPGVPKHLPELVRWQEMGRCLQSEMNLFFELCETPIVGITGSSGKTTTTTLIGEMLRTAGYSTWVGGNIGTPLIDKVDELKTADWVVLELSSFQLETLSRSPQVAVITNVTPNHLDVHPTMEDYVAAKERIFRFQSPSDYLVVNYDYEITRNMAPKAPGRTACFSRLSPRPDCCQVGAFVESEEIVVYWPSLKKNRICPVSDIKLLGTHNVENVLAAATAASICGVERDAVREVALSFRGVEHRLEPVGVLNGAAYYNDSIATTPSRAIAGLMSFSRPVVLIAGGYDKKLPFDEFADVAVERCKAVLLLGATAEKIAEAIYRSSERLKKDVSVRRVKNLDEAVKEAASIAEHGDVVLLSPACASYDMFRNYAERGDQFRTLVRDMVNSSAISR